jgi:hypothetical protein
MNVLALSKSLNTGGGGRPRSGSLSQTSGGGRVGCYPRQFESKDLLRGLVCVGVFASVLSHQQRTGVQGKPCRVKSPALPEGNRRPENATHMGQIRRGTAPILLREGRIPTAYQEIAEGEPIMRKANSGRKLGVSKIYTIRHKFQVIPKKDRLAYLIRKSQNSSWTGVDRSYIVTMRTSFNRMRSWRFPIAGMECYCCDRPARIRHHVTPLNRGGRNKNNNIVPLCHGCHAEVHPWLKAGG